MSLCATCHVKVSSSSADPHSENQWCDFSCFEGALVACRDRRNRTELIAAVYGEFVARFEEEWQDPSPNRDALRDRLLEAIAQESDLALREVA